MIIEKLDNNDLLNELINTGVLELEHWKIAKTFCLLIIKDDFDQFVGMMAISVDRIESDAIAIDDFEIVRSNRNSGLGARAYYQFEDIVKKMGCRKITLTANDCNAERFWKKVGFSNEPDYGDGGIYMYKLLDSSY